MAANQCAMRREICKQWGLHLSSSRKEHTFFPNYAAMGKKLPSKQEKQVARITLRQPPSHCQCRLKLCHKKWGWVAENKRGYQLDCSLVSGRQLFYKRQQTFSKPLTPKAGRNAGEGARITRSQHGRTSASELSPAGGFIISYPLKRERIEDTSVDNYKTYSLLKIPFV